MKDYAYSTELAFLTKALAYNKIDFRICSRNESFVADIDLEIQKGMGLSENASFIHKVYQQELTSNTLCFFTDEFYCHHIIFILPETDPEQVAIIGPYFTDYDNENIHSLLFESDIAPTWRSVLQNFYAKTACLPNNDSLNAILFSFADFIWGENNYKVNYYENGIVDATFTLATPPDAQKQLDILSNIDLIEGFYANENALMHAISYGQTVRAKNILGNIPLFNFRQQTEPLQNLKIFTIILNTLFRKAAEQGGVHPVYVDQLSNAIFQKITDFTRSDNILDLWNDMIQKYCSLVNNHTTREFSLPIQKVIIRINMDVSADLSLKTLAEYLNVNASYLSNLFRKETGDTLTNYVNKKRMDYATYLLTNTALPISSVAQHCGILDDNYFTKLFKKHYQVTPTQFRESIGKHDLTNYHTM